MADYNPIAGNPSPANGAPPQGQMKSPSPGMPEPVSEARYDLAGNLMPDLPPSPAMSPVSAVSHVASLGSAAGPGEFQPAPPPAPSGYLPPLHAKYTANTSGQTPSPPITVAAESGGKGKTAAIVGSLVGVAVIAGIFCFVKVANPAPVPAPVSFTRYQSKDGTLSCDAPKDWDVTGANDEGSSSGDVTVGGILFKSGSARIDITTDRLSTLVGGAMLGPGDTATTMLSYKPDLLNKNFKRRIIGVYKNYSEAKLQPLKTQYGEGWVTEWTADGVKFSLGGAVHGFRVSLVGVDRTATVLCQCQEGDWTTLKPAFTRVVNSISEHSAGKPGDSTGFTNMSKEEKDAGGATDTPAAGAPPNGQSAPQVLSGPDILRPDGTKADKPSYGDSGPP